MLKNTQWRAGLLVISHARQKDRTVFSAKKVKLQQNWQTLQTMPNQEKSNRWVSQILQGTPFFPVCFDEFQYQVETFFFASWRLIVHHTEELRRKFKCPCWLGRSFWHCSIDFDRFCPHFGSFKTMLILPIQDGIKVAAFGIVKLIPLHITSWNHINYPSFSI